MQTDESSNQRFHRIEGERAAARENAIRRAKELPLMDGVFVVTYYNNHSRLIGPRPVGLPLEHHEVFTSANDRELRDAIERVARLMGWAYRIGDAILSRDEKKYQVVKEAFYRENPGFSEKTYSAVIADGYMSAR